MAHIFSLHGWWRTS
ncbi:trp operon leader peptide [Cronobacter malonaticus]|nr:trp operon leader peptide [Cronobacter malonaticus]ELY4578159.1 trp operon leader peptide [Cronobacter sakazakii]EGT4287003.1 trp operon leader peptide [Cronobacter malonaticus]EGT4297148.1 trp operon leader peptide [Cronobacter malonaticus]EGT4312950.1 trp operon leader peptide [Cronobacter malonaticus]